MSAQRDPRHSRLSNEQSHRATVRRIIQSLLRSDVDLDAFCMDYFSAVHARFTQGMDRVGKINVLLEQIESRDVIARLRERYASDPGALTAIHHLLAGPGNEEERHTRAQWEMMERLYLQREKLLGSGESTASVDKEIVAGKRAQRQAAQVGEGDVLQERYRLIELIGRGGFAKVWKAFDRVVKRTVAVKILHSEQSDQLRRIERFERGARQMQALHHPHIVRVLDGPEEENGFHYFVMDYLPGGDLFQAVSTKKLDCAAALRVILQVSEALEYAHKRGLVHRDVKPQNILLDEQGAARLTDFDLVWAPDTTGGTHTGFLGTHVYVAPEQAENAKVTDARADIYSLGMTALFVLYGRSLPQAAIYHRADFVAQLGCSQRAGVLLRHATAIDAANRLDNMARFRKLLSLAIPDIFSLPPRDPPAPQALSTAEQKPGPESPPAASQRKILHRLRMRRRIWIGSLTAALMLGSPALYYAGHSLLLRRAVAQWFPSVQVPQDAAVELKILALKEKFDKQQWESTLIGLDELLEYCGPTLLPEQRLAIASLREKSLSEQRLEVVFKKLGAAAAKQDDEEVMRLYGQLPMVSVYQSLAQSHHAAAVKRYVAKRLSLAELLRSAGLCAEYQAGVEQVLKVAPGNTEVIATLAKPCDPNRAGKVDSAQPNQSPVPLVTIEKRPNSPALTSASASRLPTDRPSTTPDPSEPHPGPIDKPTDLRPSLRREWWHDSTRGCGVIEEWRKTHRLKDLPGCDRELTPDAPPGEVAMLVAKRALHGAERILESGSTQGVEELIQKAVLVMNNAGTDSRLNWARPYYAEAVKMLQAKLASLEKSGEFTHDVLERPDLREGDPISSP